MKKYLTHILVALVVVSGGYFATQIYKKEALSKSETKSKIEALQGRTDELEMSNIEQSQIIENLKGELAQTKDGQIKKLEDDVNKLQMKITNSNTKQLESKVSAVEKSVSDLEESSEDSAGTAYFFGKAMDATRAMQR